MANQYLQQLDAVVTPDGTYLVPISDDPSGTGRLKKITLTNLLSLTDHGALTGLADDDHLQYVAKDGRDGGQSITGGTAAGNKLTLQSTSNATKGQVEVPQGDKLRIGNYAPSTSAPLEIGINASGAGFVVAMSSTEYTIFQSGGVQKGIQGVGTTQFVVANAGHVVLRGGNIETLRCANSGSTPQIGFLGATPVARPTVTGSRSDPEAALASALAALDSLGLLTNNTTA